MKRPSAKEAATGALPPDAYFGRRTEAPAARQHAFQHVVAVHEMVLERARDVLAIRKAIPQAASR
jgi:hypothetical protein